MDKLNILIVIDNEDARASRLRACCGHEPGCGAGGAGEAAGQRSEATRAVPLRRR